MSMRTLGRRWWGSGLLLVLVSTAAAQSGGPGEIGIFMDPAGTESTGRIADFVPFDLYVVGFDPPGGVLGFEYSIAAPPSFTLLESWLPAGLNTGSPTNVILGLDQCLSGTGPVLLQRIRYVVVSPGAGGASDQLVCLGPSVPPSLGSHTPLWMDCSNGWNAFSAAQSGGINYPDGCLVLNPSVPGCCPLYHAEATLSNTLALPGATASARFSFAKVWDNICLGAEETAKTSCIVAIANGLRFDVEFDPGVLTWTGLSLLGGRTDPVTVNELSPGLLHVQIGWFVDPSSTGILEASENIGLATLGFAMNPAGGTSPVHVRNIVGYDAGWDLEMPALDLTALVSDDLTVPVESPSFGALKARY